MNTASRFFDELNQQYLHLHKTKEDLFWQCYMGSQHQHAALAQAESALQAFIADPQRLQETKAHLQNLPVQTAQDQALQHGLRGWLALFSAHCIQEPSARELMQELIARESAFFAANQQTRLYHLNQQGERELASLSALQMNLLVNPDETQRKASFAALQQKELHVLENSFLDIVRLRNRFAQALGFPNFFAYQVQRNESMSVASLFAILDDFELRTRSANLRTLNGMAAERGASALAPWNIGFYQKGEVTRAFDPYLPFGPALRRWVESFARLGISFRGAQLQLDLLERVGKFENGFCHAPIPSHYDANGKWVAGAINFTSLAKPDQAGSGAKAMATLFHEGGHAAHFANVTQNSPCFSQEFAPTSMAYAETQSMFCDSLLNDADWLMRYAKDAQGSSPPETLLRARIEQEQPFLAFEHRKMALVAYFEAALYQMDEEKLDKDSVLRLARATETTVLGLSASPRPLLSMPHLLSRESAASYHGYLLARMAVEQTRNFFIQRDGYLCDNPNIGPDLAKHYWQPGNGVQQQIMLQGLTGEGFNPQYLAERCNLSAVDAWEEARASMQAAQARAIPSADAGLNAHIRIVHGETLIADNSESDAVMCDAFETWLARHYSLATPA